MDYPFFIQLLWMSVAWVGHAVLWTAFLNHVYGRPFTKKFLKPWRLFTGAVIAGFPFVWLLTPDSVFIKPWYEYLCWLMLAVFLVITIERLVRPKPRALLSSRSDLIDFWPTHRHALIGNGLWSWLPKLPWNCVFKLEVTHHELQLKHLPAEWSGLKILLLSDFHFHGTPSLLWYECVFDHLSQLETPDLVVLDGDFLDSDEHFLWLDHLLTRLQWKELGLAILGNHDAHFGPERIRQELERLNYHVLGNGWKSLTIRGVPVTAIGNECPWFLPIADLSQAPKEPFRLCLSHCPDQFYWCKDHGMNLVLCGHAHGGQIRVPVIGSIFVPCVYGRRFDQGVFQSGDTVMVVNRGFSGKEPLRFRCYPQAIVLTLNQPQT